jgi:hypothetical protein
MEPGMTDNALNPVLIARGFKIIFTTTRANISGIVMKFLFQGTKIQVSQGTNSGLDAINQV